MLELTSAQWLRQIADEFDATMERNEHRIPDGKNAPVVQMTYNLTRELCAQFREIATEIERLTDEPEGDMKYRYSVEFNDFVGGKQIEVTQPPTANGDVGYFRQLLAELEERAPEFAQYIVDTANLIVEATQ